jgi:FkbM family methyltransferase
MPTIVDRAVARVRRELGIETGRGTSLSRDLDALIGRSTVRTVVDVGANTGQSALAFRRLFPQAHIYSIEPVAAIFAELQRNIRHLDRADCFNLALGASAGEVLVHTYDIGQLCSIDHADGASGAERATMTTLTAFAEGQGLEAVDFLKIDVEGHELQVLEGARDVLAAWRVGFILVETGLDDTLPRFTPLARVQHLLRPLGYELYGLYDQSSWTDHVSLMYANALFVAPALLSRLRGN